MTGEILSTGPNDPSSKRADEKPRAANPDFPADWPHANDCACPFCYLAATGGAA